MLLPTDAWVAMDTEPQPSRKNMFLKELLVWKKTPHTCFFFSYNKSSEREHGQENQVWKKRCSNPTLG